MPWSDPPSADCFEIVVETDFHARHAIRLPDGTVEAPHEHLWQLSVTVGRTGLDALGLVMDFHALQDIVAQAIGPARNGDFNRIEPFGTDGGQTNPTAEAIARWLAQRVGPRLPASVRLVQVSLGEAPGCRARWRST